MRLEHSFLPADGIGPVTERRLWQGGVTSWADVDTDVGNLIGPTRADSLRRFVDAARPRLRAADAQFFARRLPDDSQWRLVENFRADACGFDIETTGLTPERAVITTVSFHRDGETTTLVRGDDLTGPAVRDQFDAASLLVSYNGARFDVPFLRAAFGLEVTTPHIDLMSPCRAIGLDGGLKQVERDLGMDRETDIDGREAIDLWHRYRAGDDAALDRLVRYNRRDATTLLPILDEVTDRLHHDVFEPHVAD